MSIPLLNLDDRTFVDLFEEMRALIPRYAPDWTNHNVADPGIMLLELFAWLTETTIYRANRVPEASKMRFLRLLGAALEPAQPSQLKLQVTATYPAQPTEPAQPTPLAQPWSLPRGTLLAPSRQSGLPPITFETLHDVVFTLRPEDVSATAPGGCPLQGAAIVAAQQVTRVVDEPLGISNGGNFQLFPVAKPFLLLPQNPFPVPPKVYVNGEPWQFVAKFPEKAPEAKHFTIKLWLNEIAFGDGVQGQIPSDKARITVSYRYALSAQGRIQNAFLGESNGKPHQRFPLQKKILLLDLQEPSDLEPKISVDNVLWGYQPDWLAMEKNAKEFIVEPWRNAIRFGDGAHGQVPSEGTEIKISYAYTERPVVEIPTGTSFSVIKIPGIKSPGIPLPGNNIPVNENGKLHLDVKALTMVAIGSDATGLEEGESRALDMIQPRWRTVTAEDFEAIVVDSAFNIARAQSLPGHNLDASDQDKNWPGHVSVVIAPGAIANLQAGAETLDKFLCFSPDGGRLVALTRQGIAQLWDLAHRQILETNLGVMQERAEAVFSTDSQRLLTIDDNNAVNLWDATSGEKLTASNEPKPTISAQFSQDGKYFVTISTDHAAHLHDARYGTDTLLLSKGSRVDKVLFSPGGQWLATVGADSIGNIVHLWGVTSLDQNAELRTPAPVTVMRFSPDDGQLATVTANVIQLWRTTTGKQIAELKHSSTNAEITDVYFALGGERLVTLEIAPDGTKVAWLWSTRSQREIVNLTEGSGIIELAFSPDKHWLAVRHIANIVRLWDVRRGTKLAEFHHAGTVTALAFSPSGQQLVTVSDAPTGGKTARLWELRTPEQAPIEITTSVAALSQSGNWLAIADGHLLRIWSIGEKRPSSVLYLDDVASVEATASTEAKEGTLKRVEALPNTPYLFTVSETTEAQPDGQPLVLRTLQLWYAEHVDAVRKLIDERRLVTCQHHVAGAMYTDIYIKATVVRGLPIKATDSLQEEIAGNVLAEFFHPLRGGPERTGWPWGRNVYLSEVYQVLESVAGVDHVEALLIDTTDKFLHPIGNNDSTALSIPAHHLVNYIVRPKAIKVIDAGPIKTPIANLRGQSAAAKQSSTLRHK